MELAEEQRNFMADLVAEKLERVRAQLKEVEDLYLALETGKETADTLQRVPTKAKEKPTAVKRAEKAEPAGKSKYTAVYPTRDGKWQGIVANKYLGTFATQEEAAEAAAKAKRVPVEQLLKKTGSPGKPETATKPKKLKVSKLDLREANIDEKDAQWINEE